MYHISIQPLKSICSHTRIYQKHIYTHKYEHTYTYVTLQICRVKLLPMRGKAKVVRFYICIYIYILGQPKIQCVLHEQKRHGNEGKEGKHIEISHKLRSCICIACSYFWMFTSIVIYRRNNNNNENENKYNIDHTRV